MNQPKPKPKKSKPVFTQAYQLAVSVCVSAAMAACLVIHLLYPAAALDTVSLILLGIAVLPWLLPLFKSIKLPGGLELEPAALPARDRFKLDEAARRAGLTSGRSVSAQAGKYREIARSDVKLMLAGIRLDIEDRLKKLAEQRNIPCGKPGIVCILEELEKNDCVELEESAVISEFAGMLDEAVHGGDELLDYGTVEWAIGLGSSVVERLDGKLNTHENAMG